MPFIFYDKQVSSPVFKIGKFISYMQHIFFKGVEILRYLQLKKTVVLFVVIGLIGTGFIQISSSSYFSYEQSNNSFIGLEDAQKVAEAKFSMNKVSEYVISESYEIKNDGNFPLMYLFLINPEGYIVVPANKILPPIIAFSFENEFGSISEDNVLLQLLKADISSRIDHIDLISENIVKIRLEQWQKYLNPIKIIKQNLVSTVGPLLNTKWSQLAPYNNFCPIDLDSGKRSVAGCPAVAMAQILHYHKTIQNVQFTDDDDYIHNYGGNYYTIDDDSEDYDFPSFPELNVYLDTLRYNYDNEIPLTNDDKAAINFACGIAAEQVYSPKGSGTFGVDQAFQAYQRFNFEDIELLQTEPDVYDRLQSNILNGLPAHIAVVNEGWTSGHNMVVDGYDDEGYFHINFGWGGSYDGWYSLPEDLPLSLTVLEGLIVDIDPAGQNEGLVGNGFLCWTDIPAGSTVNGNFTIQNSGNPGSSIDWEVTSWPGWGTWTFTPESGVDLKPEDGELTIEVSVIAPDKINEAFNGYVKVVNTENSSDYCIIHISLTTPRSLKTNHLFIQFFENHPFLFWLFNNIIRPIVYYNKI